MRGAKFSLKRLRERNATTPIAVYVTARRKMLDIKTHFDLEIKTILINHEGRARGEIKVLERLKFIFVFRFGFENFKEIKKELF